MMLRIGISRQQYQRLESKGNPRLDTLALVVKGLNSELMLIPKEKLKAVQVILESELSSGISQHTEQGVPTKFRDQQKKSLSDDPWQGLDEINVLRLTLHGQLEGYLAGFLNGRNVLSFADEFVADAERPTFSLITHPSFQHFERRDLG